MKTNSFFLSEIFQLLEVKCSIYLNRRVFVMCFRKVAERLPTADVSTQQRAKMKSYMNTESTLFNRKILSFSWT